VWDWKAGQRPAMAPPGRRVSGPVVRDFAIGLVIAAGLYVLGRPVIALVAVCISAAVLTVRALLPASISTPLMAAAGRVAHQAGHAVTVVVLAAVYFTVFPLFRAWRAATGSDSLRLKAGRQGPSFWIDRATLPETSPDKPY
jgi:hypothetical protein